MFIICFSILLLFYNFCHKNLHIFALPSSAVLKPAQAGLVLNWITNKIVSIIRIMIKTVTFKIMYWSRSMSELNKYNLMFKLHYLSCLLCRGDFKGKYLIKWKFNMKTYFLLHFTFSITFYIYILYFLLYFTITFHTSYLYDRLLIFFNYLVKLLKSKK